MFGTGPTWTLTRTDSRLAESIPWYEVGPNDTLVGTPVAPGEGLAAQLDIASDITATATQGSHLTREYRVMTFTLRWKIESDGRDTMRWWYRVHRMGHANSGSESPDVVCRYSSPA